MAKKRGKRARRRAPKRRVAKRRRAPHRRSTSRRQSVVTPSAPIAPRKKQDNSLHKMAGFVLGLAAVIHLWRLLKGMPLVLGDWMVPMGISWVLLIVAGYLALSLWKTR